MKMRWILNSKWPKIDVFIRVHKYFVSEFCNENTDFIYHNFEKFKAFDGIAYHHNVFSCFVHNKRGDDHYRP